MSDDGLGAKFLGLAAPVLGGEAAARLLGDAWRLPTHGDLGWIAADA